MKGEIMVKKKKKKKKKAAEPMMCIDGVSECRPNDKPPGYCEFCGG